MPSPLPPLSQFGEIKINYKDVFQLEQFVLSNVHTILALETCDTMLELDRVFNILWQLETVYKDSTYLGPGKVCVVKWTELKDHLKSDGDTYFQHTSLVVVEISKYEKVNKEDDIYTLEKLVKYFSNTKSKKIILIYSVERILCLCAGFLKEYGSKFLLKRKITNICFQDCTENTQKELLNQPCILFQGNPTSLKEFLGPDAIVAQDLNNIFNYTVLKNIIFHKLPIIIGMPKIGTDQVDIDNASLYVERRFLYKRFVSNRLKKLLTNNSEFVDVFVFCGIKDKHQLTDIFKIPRKKCQRIFNNENVVTIQNREDAQSFFNGESALRPIHLIRYDKSCLFSWVCSKNFLGKLHNLTYRASDLTSTLSDLVKKKVVILSGQAGIGKSTTLRMLGNVLQTSWIIKVDLSKCLDTLVKIPDIFNQQYIIQFLSEWVKPHFLVSGLLNYYLFNVSQKSLYILFDGFDHMVANIDHRYYKRFITLLKYLNEHSQAYVWVAARPENIEDLEYNLMEFSTEFAPITSEEQHDILYKFCKMKSKDQIDEFYNSHKNIVRSIPSFLGSPLVVKILSELMQLNDTFDISNPSSGFCDFVDCFVKMRIEKYMREHFPDTKHKNEIINYLYGVHGVVAITGISPVLDVLMQLKNETFHVDISEVGFTSKIKLNTFQFDHGLFAEYFATNMFYKWILNPISCPMENLLLFNIFLETKFKVIRLFLNYRCQQPPPAMPQCVTHRLIHLWKQEQRNFFNSNGECVLHVLINEDLSNLVNWFFHDDFIVHILPLLSTRYQLFKPCLLPKVRKYRWALNLLTINEDLTDKLFNSVRNNKLEDVKELLDPIKDIVVRTYMSASRSTTALHLAASLGFKDIVEYLVNGNIPIDILDTTNSTPIQCAASNGHLDIVTYLKEKNAYLNNRDYQSKTALSRSAGKGYLDIVKFLLIEAKATDGDALDKNGLSALQNASKSGHIDVVRLLLNRGFDVNYKAQFGNSALAWAVVTGNTAMVDFLISVGSDISFRDQHGRNLVHMAVKANQFHVVKYLTFCLIDINIPDWNNIFPLQEAVKSGSWNIVEHLILEGACIRTNVGNGIHTAITANQLPVALLMLERGTSLSLLTLEEKEILLNEVISSAEDTLSAFYELIRVGNVELLQLFIEKNGLSDVSKVAELNRFLAEPYEELLLKNVTLSNEIKSYVEGKLVQLRYAVGQKFKLSEEDVKERAHFIIDQVQILKNNYLNPDCREIDQDFIIRTRFIAQNIDLLKRSVRKPDIPWEQMEFCLVIFMNFFLKPQHEDFVYRLILDQQKLIIYLDNFSESLLGYLKNQDSPEEYLEELENDYRIMKDIYSLNRISYYIKLALSASKDKNEVSPYVLMRCLQVIGESFKNTTDSPNLSDDVHKYLFLSAPTNVTQIVTSLRNSLSHSHTYKMKTETENTLKSDLEYFQAIESDLKKILLQIDFLLFTKKKETFKIFHNKCLKLANEPERLNNINRYINWDTKEQISIEDYNIDHLDTVKNLVRELKRILQDSDQKDQELVNQLSSEIYKIEKKVYSPLDKSKLQYFNMRSKFKSLKKCQHSQFLDSPEISYCTSRKAGIYNSAVSIADSLLGQLQTKKNVYDKAVSICFQLCCIMKWDAHKVESIQEIDSNLSGKLDNANDNFIHDVFIRIQNKLKNQDDKNAFERYFLEKQELHKKLKKIKETTKDLSKLVPENIQQAVDELNITKKDKINLKKNFGNNKIQVFNNIIGNLDEYGKLLKNCNTDKFYKALKGFWSRMENTAVNTATVAFITEEEKEFKRIFIDKFNILVKLVQSNKDTLTNNQSLQSAIEILLLDVLEACLSQKAIVEYVLSFDEYTPLLVGTALRNYLAHGTPLIDILPFEPLHAIISTVNILNQNVGNLFATAPASSEYSLCNPPTSFTKCLAALEENCYNKKRDTKLDNTIYDNFLKAASRGDLQTMERFINNITPKEQNDDNKNILNTAITWPAVLVASKNGHEHIVEALLRTFRSTHLKTIKPKINPLIFKNFARSLSMYDINLNKINVNNASLCDQYLDIAFRLTVEHGHQKILQALLKFQANIDITDDNHINLLLLAADKGHQEIVRIFLENHAKVDVCQSDQCTPMHLAASNGHHETVKILLSYHGNVNARQENQYTPLHISAAHGHLEVVKLLLQHNAEIDALTENHETPLHLAVQNKYVEVTKLLLKHKANVNALDKDEITPIYLAVANGHEELVKILLESQACINMAQGTLTPLHISALYNKKDITKLLLERQINVDAIHNGLTALHYASVAGHSDVIQVLLHHDANIHAIDKDNFTALHFASLYGHKSSVDILLQHQANVNSKAINRSTPLHLAASHGHTEIVQCLLKYEAYVNTVDVSTGYTPLHSSASNGYEDIVNILLNHHADIHALTLEGAMPLHYSAANGHEAVVETLINHGAKVDAQDHDLVSPLHISAQNGHEAVAKVLIKYNANVDIVMQNGATPLHMCAINDQAKLIKLLIENKANIEAETNCKDRPLHVAARYGSIDAVEMLLKYKANINAVSDGEWTALHYSTINGHADIVNILLKHQANINVKTTKLWTPLHMSAQKGYETIVQLLLDQEADVNVVISEAVTALHLAAERGHKKIVEMLLASKANVNAVSINEYTPLHSAVEEGYEDIAQLLITHQANVNAKTSDLMTPLHLAAQGGHKNIVSTLLKSHADVNAVDKNQIAPLYLAAQGGYLDIVDQLASHEANVNITTSDDLTPLHASASQGHQMVVYVLLELQASVNAITKEQATALHLAAENGHNEVVKTLLQNNAEVNALKSDLSTPLHLASKNGHLEVVKVLLENHANINALRKRKTTTNNNASTVVLETALSIAQQEGHQDIVSTLLDNGAIEGFEQHQ